MAAVGQAATGQTVHHGTRQGEVAVGLQLGRKVGETGVGAGRIEHRQQLRHTGVVSRRTGDGGVIRQAIVAEQPAVVLQRCRQRGRGGIAAGWGLTYNGECGQRRVTGKVSGCQLEVVIAQHQLDSSKAKAAIGRRRGGQQNRGVTGRAQRQQRTRIDLAL